MAFYGRVTYTNGTAIPNGYYIIAKIGSVVSGQCGIINSDYGKGTNTCIVVTHSTSASRIDFFLGSVKVGESTFQSKEIVNLNFNIETLPPREAPLSDGICKSTECSYNVLDCDNSITKFCVGNGVCDSIIGETCENTVGDCGACPVINPPSSGGGSSGGGGGGGGGSSKTNNSNVIVLLKNDSSTSSSVSETGGVTNENTNNELEEKNTGLFGITGLSIGNFVKSPTGKGILIFAILVAVFVVLFVVSKKINSKRHKDIGKDKIFSNGKSNKRYSKQKNIKVVKLSEMKKRNAQN
jgi:hypothetical protein